MRPIRSSALSTARLAELDRCYRGAPEARVRIRALMVLLAAERGMVAAEIAVIVRQHEETVRRWLVRYRAEGPAGLADVVRVGAPPEGTPAYRERPPASVRRRPRALGLPFSLWTGARLADHLAEGTGLRVSARSVYRFLPLPAGGGHPPEPAAAPDHEPGPGDPEYALKKRRPSARATI